MQEIILDDAHLTAEELAHRWKMTPHTLGQWRWKGHGPQFFKLGGKVLYRHEEIEKFENTSTEVCTRDVTIAGVEDPRFLCINLEALISRQEEDEEMDP